MKKLLYISLILFSVKAFSVLPPFYHSINEIKAIISDERLHDSLGSAELILDIKKNDKGYVITTNKSTLQVDVTYIPQELIGATKFELTFHDKKPRMSLFGEDNNLIEDENKYSED